MRQRWWIGALVAGVVLIAGCSSEVPVAPWPLPDRSDPEVVQAEERIRFLVEATDVAGGSAECEVRYLGSDDEAEFAQVSCLGKWGEAGPVRVEGDRVLRPDEATYEEDLRRLFPEGLRQLMREDPDGVRP